MRIGILGHPTRADVCPAIDQFTSVAERHGVELFVAEDLRELCGAAGRAFLSDEDLVSKAEILIALGGDGTMLRAARLVRDVGTPILGINLGRLGFLTGAAPDTLDQVIKRLAAADYTIEERTALQASVGDVRSFALNEIVIEKGVLARMVQVKTWISDIASGSFFSNGLIVSTPTGSTGYNLSAGGPVLHPSMDAVVLTPICPHSLTLRPIVVPSDQSVRVQLVAEHSDIMLTADGQTVTSLEPAQPVLIEKAPTPVRLINLDGLSFYELLRRKLDWSQDRREREE